MSSSADFVFRQLRPLLFSGDAETAHERMLSSVEMVSKIPGVIPFLRWQFREDLPVLHTKLFGKTVNNPIGLAAGFDKDGRIYPTLFALGFGFVEIGTVTPLPQAGNLKPRIFRLLEDQALVNRLGFNNQGIQKLVEKLDLGTKKISTEEADMINQSSEQHEKFSSGMLGINIGKNGDTSLEKAREDYVSALSALHPFADYFTINISSPNTEGLRKLQEKQMLRELLESVCSRRDKLDQNHIRKTPLLVKLSPDLDDQGLQNCTGVIKEFPIQGVIATNTTLDRQQLKSSQKIEQGGLSGKPLKERSTEVVRTLFQELGNEVTIIGTGGIFNGTDAYQKIRAGAAAVQIYTALIYEGPGLVRRIKQELAELLERDGFNCVTDVIGIDS
ncbi:MAG: quinone-dependent dihydroorotate dehydrogenase [SAR324 cluster bacterium]|nr:quinone-dependent dihydroorotate dehydrogenase [SAR324 cluster bacterium]